MTGGRYRAYPEYKDSGVAWLGEIPLGWSTKKLKFFAKVQPSNVDKKTKASETPVLLCNYTDVYHQENIVSCLPFMKASATPEQIKTFLLKSGDTIITKDSEDPNDIAIPAFVPFDLNQVICGYHLSLIRAHNALFGSFIKRVFECGYAKAYFATKANGLTRYGLSVYAINNILFPLPSIAEAMKIANFLDHETAKIDALIEKQKQLIKLLKEKRQAVISHAVTKGLNPNAPMKDSGVPWLGEVPAHWLTPKVGQITKLYRGKFSHRPRNEPRFFGGKYPFIQTGDISNANAVIRDYCQTLNDLGIQISQNFPKGTLLMGIVGAKIGSTAILNFDCYCPDSIIGFFPSKSLNIKFLRYFFLAAKNELVSTATQSAQQNLNIERVSALKALLPSPDEQEKIVKFLDAQSGLWSLAQNRAKAQITLLQERRTALISAAVTGKIDVRDWTPPETRQQDESHQEVAP